MTGHVVCADQSMSLAAFMALLEKNGISGAPVRDGQGHAVGVVSKTDLMRALFEDERRDRAQLTVGQVMTCFSLTLPPEASIAHAAALLAYEGVHRIVILAGNGEVAGIVTPLDIARFVAQQSGCLQRAAERSTARAPR